MGGWGFGHQFAEGLLCPTSLGVIHPPVVGADIDGECIIDFTHSQRDGPRGNSQLAFNMGARGSDHSGSQVPGSCPWLARPWSKALRLSDPQLLPLK